MTAPAARTHDPDEPRRLLRPAGLADRPRAAARPLPAARARARAVARRPARTSRRRRTTPRCSPSRDQERAGLDIVTDGEMRRESYSNRFATALDGRRHRQPRHRARPQRPPEPGAARGRPDRPAGTRSRCATCEFLRAHTEPHRSRSRCPGPFTMSQQAQNDYYGTRAELGAGLRRARSTPRSSTCSRPAPTSSRSTSPTCRPGPSRRASTASRRSTRALDGIAGTTGRPHLLRLRRDHPRAARAATRSCPSWPPRSCDQISIETAQSGPRPRRARRAARQDDHPRRARPRRPTRSRRPRSSPTGSAARFPHAAPSGSSPRPTAA